MKFTESKIIFTLLVLSLFLIVNCKFDLLQAQENRSANALQLGVMPANSTLLGKKLGDWGSEWWKWAYSFNKDYGPVADLSGKLCGLGQNKDSDVWFLAGSYSTKSVVRECTIPQGKVLFFPIINAIQNSTKEKTRTCNDVTQSVKKRTQIPYNLFVRIDGILLTNPYKHRETSTICFDPMEKFYGNKTTKSWAYPAASDGYWIALEPLSLGTHVLQFGGDIHQFKQDITYKIHVVPAGQEIPENVSEPSITR